MIQAIDPRRIAVLAMATVAVYQAPAAAPFADPLASGGRGPAMVPIDIGKLRMGKLADDEWCVDNDPTHHVEIRHPFAMSRDEITVAEFEYFVRSTGYVTSAEEQARLRSLAGRRTVPEGACVHSSFTGHAPHRAEVGAHWRDRDIGKDQGIRLCA